MNNMLKQNKSWWILVIVSIGVMVPFVYPYLTLDPANSRIEITSTTIQYPVLVTHIILAFTAMITGFLQFLDQIRLKKPRIHRIIGRIYVVSVFISGLLAVVLYFYADSFTKALAFLVLAILWLFTTGKAYQKAVKRNYKEHRKWMIRSLATTLVAVSGRILVPIILLCFAVFHSFSLPGGIEQTIQEVLKVNIWVGLVFDIVIVEWVILNRKFKTP